jgi:hypothetical protein
MQEFKYLAYVVSSDLMDFGSRLVYNIEYPYFRKLVLLNDLRTLYGIEDYMLAFAYQIFPHRNKRNFAKACPHIYEYLFVKKHPELHHELMKSEFPQYYKYIIKNDDRASNKFKTYHLEIIRLMNHCMRKLIILRDKISDIKKDFNSEDYDKIPINLIAGKTKKKVSLDAKVINAIATANEGAAAKIKIRKITWNRTAEQLLNLFKDLKNDGYINGYSKEFLLKHFAIKFNANNNASTFEDSDNRIKWLKPKTMTILVFLFDYLERKTAISFVGNINYELVCQIFCKPDGTSYDPHVLTQTSINLLNHKGGKWNSYPDFRDLIDENIKKNR